MKQLIVPLVLRAKDYQHIAPIGSYIAVDQFESMTQLVTYLKMLSTNTTEYLKYFEWTRTYRGSRWQYEFGSVNVLCEMCKLLYNRSAPAKSYADLGRWWSDEAKCEQGFGRHLAIKQTNGSIP
jgi:glycoprotein 3-alpha-L-fucosyltransferase